MLVVLLLLVKCWMKYEALLLESSIHQGIIKGIVNYSNTPQGQLTTDRENTAKAEDTELWETCTESRESSALQLQQNTSWSLLGSQ